MTSEIDHISISISIFINVKCRSDGHWDDIKLFIITSDHEVFEIWLYSLLKYRGNSCIYEKKNIYYTLLSSVVDIQKIWDDRQRRKEDSILCLIIYRFFHYHNNTHYFSIVVCKWFASKIIYWNV